MKGKYPEIKLNHRQSKRVYDTAKKQCCNCIDYGISHHKCFGCILYDSGKTYDYDPITDKMTYRPPDCIWKNYKEGDFCPFFWNNVLPNDPILKAEIEHKELKICVSCGKHFYPSSNRQRFCPSCSVLQRRIRERDRKRRSKEKSIER